MNKTIIIIATTILLVIFVGFFMSFANMSANVISPVVSGIFVLYPLIASLQEDKKNTRIQRIKNIVKNEGHLSPLLAAFMFFCQLIFVERLSSGFIGGVAGGTLGLAGIPVEETTKHVIVIGAIFTNFILFIVIIPISKVICYKIANHPLRWLFLTLLASKLFSAILGFLFGIWDLLRGNFTDKITAISVDIIVFTLIHSLSVFLGFLWSKLSRKGYILYRIFKQLTIDEQETLIDLAKDIPQNHCKT